MNPMIEVSAGIVRRADGRILVCQRGEGRRNAHLWEFPGGKREPGETAAQCLARELMEELSLPVSQIKTLCARVAQGISFTFLTAYTDAEPIRTEHEDIRFCLPEELLSLPFCPADTVVAQQLALQRVKYFLWDFDGTLADTYPQLTQVVAAVCQEQGIQETNERLLNLLKVELPHALRVLAAENQLDIDFLRERYEHFRLIYDASLDVPPLDGILPLLKQLAENGGKHYLVTHRDLYAMDVLKAWGVDTLFAGHMLRGDEGFVRKPNPNGIRFLLSKEDIPAHEAIMIGDRPLDVQAGHAAGVFTCLLDTENRFPDEPCDLRVSSVEALQELLTALPK